MSRRGGKQRTTPSIYGKHGNYEYWQSAADNNSIYYYYVDVILKMAMSRFRWLNLPETCDERYLELVLITQGMATIAFPKQMRGTFFSLKCTPQGKLNRYSRPRAWLAMGDDGTKFRCSNETGVVIYDNETRYPLMSGIMQYANELTHVRITKRINRLHQQIPFILKGPQEKRQDMVNLFKQVAGGEPAVLGFEGIENIDYEAMSTGVQFIGEELAADETNVWNRIYTMLGIQNSTFKQERQTEDEVRAQQEPTTLVAASSLTERRKAADKLNERFEQYLKAPIEVVWRQDNLSENFNYRNNILTQARIDDE